MDVLMKKIQLDTVMPLQIKGKTENINVKTETYDANEFSYAAIEFDDGKPSINFRDSDTHYHKFVIEGLIKVISNHVDILWVVATGFVDTHAEDPLDVYEHEKAKKATSTA